MKERINQLAAKAWKEVYAETAIVGSENPAPSIDEVVMFEKKFAELIVRECMTVAGQAAGLDAEYEAWYLIKEHFGVEE